LHQKNYNSTLSLVEPNRELLKIDEEINRAKTKIGTDTDVCFIQMILNQPITNIIMQYSSVCSSLERRSW
jgi:hypothetical protein